MSFMAFIMVTTNVGTILTYHPQFARKDQLEISLSPVPHSYRSCIGAVRLHYEGDLHCYVGAASSCEAEGKYDIQPRPEDALTTTMSDPTAPNIIQYKFAKSMLIPYNAFITGRGGPSACPKIPRPAKAGAFTRKPITLNNMKPRVPDIQLISSDLNGTLVHQHTMMDMIRLYFPREPERYEKAREAFTQQTAGKVSMKEAFAQAGPLTKGLRLRDAIEYAQTEVQFLRGFEELISTLYKRRKHFVITSTGYTVTTEVIKLRFGSEKFSRVICNQLVFGWNGDPQHALTNGELMRVIKDYMAGGKEDPRSGQILATGEVLLGIQDESKKASFLFRMADSLGISRSTVAHIGDTMGDSAAIADVARNGGLGIAFNYNEPLRKYLEAVQKTEDLPGCIMLVDPKGSNADLRNVLELLLSER